jgi:hypothetical protein
MKGLFRQFYRPTEAEFRKLWQSCFFALDANVLLNLYGYSEETREQLLSLIERLSSRIHLPHQFALEYQRNRAHAIMEQVKNYAKAEKTLELFYTGEILPKTKHPYLGQKSMTAFKQVQKELEKSRRKHEALFTNDSYFTRITTLLQKVGPPCGDLDKLYEKGRRRYGAKIPPGFADHKDKGEPDCFGDLIGWIQLMEIAKEEKKPAILITDDSKEDWWQIQGDRTLGPRPELLAEFEAECSQTFYMYSSDQFMRFANTFLNERVRSDAIQEVQQRLQERMRSASENKPVAGPVISTPSDAKPFVPLEASGAKNLKPTAPPKGSKEEQIFSASTEDES